MSAFLSVRLPEAVRDRLKAVAATRGESVQGLVGHLVERFLLEEESNRAPRGRTRRRAGCLSRRGVRDWPCDIRDAAEDALAFTVGLDEGSFADLDRTDRRTYRALKNAPAELVDDPS
jgi:hypothetical protein